MGGGDPLPTLPLSALRASVKPSASDLGAPAVFNRAPEEKKLDAPDAGAMTLVLRIFVTANEKCNQETETLDCVVA